MSISSVGAEPKPINKAADLDNATIAKNNNRVKEKQVTDANFLTAKADANLKVSNAIKNDAIVSNIKNPSPVALSTKQLEKVAQQLQDFVGEMNRGLEFLVDEDSGRDVIKVIDKNSGELVKQYPSEEVLTLVAKLSEMVGSFVDAKV